MTVTVKDVIDRLNASGIALPDGADRLIAGDLSAEVNAIAVAFMPSRRILAKAWELGANLVVVHEGAFYSHASIGENGGVLDAVSSAKRRWIEESGLAIYRCHDGIHRQRPDGIAEGLILELDWHPYVVEYTPVAAVVHLPSGTLGGVARHVKQRLGIDSLRAVGDPEMPCRKVGVLVGYRGGREHAVPLFETYGLDLVICGEGPEWETPEYVRDSIDMEKPKALLVVGHRESEQPGMKLLADRMRDLFPSVLVHYCREESLFRSL
ncbi:Nif3-like dinuclear metal center hexameric protein [Paenibacillaceae bacterium WGS1546]|uniref:Nif3-like dinuclear metal center hexameric protein n=1 Tax=Cohnella sp. WGS1546 TaxID=3366810 RepID=UPI00372D7A7D